MAEPANPGARRLRASYQPHARLGGVKPYDFHARPVVLSKSVEQNVARLARALAKLHDSGNGLLYDGKDYVLSDLVGATRGGYHFPNAVKLTTDGQGKTVFKHPLFHQGTDIVKLSGALEDAGAHLPVDFFLQQCFESRPHLSAEDERAIRLVAGTRQSRFI